MFEFLHRRKRRYSDENHHFGPFTYSRHSNEGWRPLAIVIDSGDNDERPGCNVRLQALGRTLLCELPAIIKPWVREGTQWDSHSREYGFQLTNGFLQVFLGPQTGDSTTTRDWSKTLPWSEWRFFRTIYYDLDGRVFWSGVECKGDRNERAAAYEAASVAKEKCPTVDFLIEDCDGQRITATTLMEQREWKFGLGWFRWLSWFRRNLVRRSLDIRFSSETGPDKGSWKGGTCGTGIDMLPGELHEDAFRRYCDQEHRAKNGKYRVRHIRLD